MRQLPVVRLQRRLLVRQRLRCLRRWLRLLQLMLLSWARQLSHTQLLLQMRRARWRR